MHMLGFVNSTIQYDCHLPTQSKYCVKFPEVRIWGIVISAPARNFYVLQDILSPVKWHAGVRITLSGTLPELHPQISKCRLGLISSLFCAFLSFSNTNKVLVLL